eukprot:2915359-Rhodomonas_salina.1
MSDEELREYAGKSLPELVRSLKVLRDGIRKTNSSKKRKAKAGSSKFAIEPSDKDGRMFQFGSLEMFKQGLDKLIGLPAPNVGGAMEREHQGTELFTTTNYGVTTFDKQ